MDSSTSSNDTALPSIGSKKVFLPRSSSGAARPLAYPSLSTPEWMNEAIRTVQSWPIVLGPYPSHWITYSKEQSVRNKGVPSPLSRSPPTLSRSPTTNESNGGGGYSSSISLSTSASIQLQSPKDTSLPVLTNLTQVIERLCIFRADLQLLLMKPANGWGAPSLFAVSKFLRTEADVLLSYYGRYLLIIDIGYSHLCKLNSTGYPYDSAIFNHQVIYIETGDNCNEPVPLHSLCKATEIILQWLMNDSRNIVVCLGADPIQLVTVLVCAILFIHYTSPYKYDTLSSSWIAGVTYRPNAVTDTTISTLCEYCLTLCLPVNRIKSYNATYESFIPVPPLSNNVAETFRALEDYNHYYGTTETSLPEATTFKVLSDSSGMGQALLVSLDDQTMHTVRNVEQLFPASEYNSYGTGFTTNRSSNSTSGNNFTETSNNLSSSSSSTSTQTNTGSTSTSSSSSSSFVPPSSGTSLTSYGPFTNLPSWLTVPILQQILLFRKLIEFHCQQRFIKDITVEKGKPLDSVRIYVSVTDSLLDRLLVDIVYRRNRAGTENGQQKTHEIFQLRANDLSLFTALVTLATESSSASKKQSKSLQSNTTVVSTRMGSVNSIFLGDKLVKPRAILPDLLVPPFPPSYINIYHCFSSDLYVSDPRIRSITDTHSNGNRNDSTILSHSFSVPILQHRPRYEWSFTEFNPMVLRYISLSRAILCQPGEVVHAEAGFAPNIMIFAYESSGNLRLLYTSMLHGRKRYRHGHGPILFPVNVLIKGEFLIRVFDTTVAGNGTRLFSFRYHTGVLQPRSNKFDNDTMNRNTDGPKLIDKWATIVHINKQLLGIKMDDLRFPTEFHVSLAVSSVPEMYRNRPSITLPPPRLAPLSIVPVSINLPTENIDILPENIFICCHNPSCGAIVKVPKDVLQFVAQVYQNKRDRLELIKRNRLASAAARRSTMITYDFSDTEEGEIDHQLTNKRNRSQLSSSSSFRQSSSASSTGLPRNTPIILSDTTVDNGKNVEEDDAEEDDKDVFSSPWLPYTDRIESVLSADTRVVNVLSNDTESNDANGDETILNSVDNIDIYDDSSALQTSRKKAFTPRNTNGTISDAKTTEQSFRKSGKGVRGSIPRRTNSTNNRKNSQPISTEASIVAPTTATVVNNTRFVSCTSCETRIYVPACGSVLAGMLDEKIATAMPIPPIEQRIRTNDKPSSAKTDTAHPFDVPTHQDAGKGIAYQAMIIARDRQKRANEKRLSQLEGMFTNIDPLVIEYEYYCAVQKNCSFDDVVNTLVAINGRIERNDRSIIALIKTAQEAHKARLSALKEEEEEEKKVLLTNKENEEDPDNIPDAEEDIIASATKSRTSSNRDKNDAVPLILSTIISNQAYFPENYPLQIGAIVQSSYGKGTILRIEVTRVSDDKQTATNTRTSSSTRTLLPSPGTSSNIGTSRFGINPWEVEAEISMVQILLPWGILYCRSPSSLYFVTEGIELAEKEKQKQTDKRTHRAMRKANYSFHYMDEYLAQRDGITTIDSEDDEDNENNSLASDQDDTERSTASPRRKKTTPQSKTGGSTSSSVKKTKNKETSSTRIKGKKSKEEIEDADLKLARQLQLEMLREAMEETGTYDNTYTPSELTLQEALVAAAPSLGEPEKVEKTPEAIYTYIPTRIIIDTTIIRELNPEYILQNNVLSPPNVPCVFLPGTVRPSVPGAPNAIVVVSSSSSSSSSSSQRSAMDSHLSAVRDTSIRSRVEGTSFDRVSINGALPATIQSLKTYIYSSSTGSDASTSSSSSGADNATTTVANDCIICYESFTPGDKVRELPCSHIFHIRCVDVWLLQDTRCPLCLKSIKKS